MEARNFSIRTARPEDVDTLARFNAELARETESLALDPDVVQRGVRAVIDDASLGSYYVAESSGRVVGALMTTSEWSDWRCAKYVWIQSVFVEPMFRGRGAFSALYAHVDSLVRADDALCGLRLYVHAENARATSTYERLGMRHYGYRVLETPDVLRPD